MEVIANGIQFPYQTVILKRWCFLWRMPIQQETQIGFLRAAGLVVDEEDSL